MVVYTCVFVLIIRNKHIAVACFVDSGIATAFNTNCQIQIRCCSIFYIKCTACCEVYTGCCVNRRPVSQHKRAVFINCILTLNNRISGKNNTACTVSRITVAYNICTVKEFCGIISFDTFKFNSTVRKFHFAFMRCIVRSKDQSTIRVIIIRNFNNAFTAYIRAEFSGVYGVYCVFSHCIGIDLYF